MLQYWKKKKPNLLPWKQVHEEDYGEEEHGESTANLGDDCEVFKIRIWNGFIKRSLQKAQQSTSHMKTVPRTESTAPVIVAN